MHNHKLNVKPLNIVFFTVAVLLSLVVSQGFKSRRQTVYTYIHTPSVMEPIKKTLTDLLSRFLQTSVSSPFEVREITLSNSEYVPLQIYSDEFLMSSSDYLNS